MTAAKAVRLTRAALEAAGVKNAGFDARQLVAAALEIPAGRLPLVLGEEISPAAQRSLDRMTADRAGGRPLQYILGSWEFYGLPFAVGEGVLIPRPETELLVDVGLEFLKSRPEGEVIDLCSGSGCIAVAVARHAPAAQVTAIELQPEAYRFTVRNIGLNHCYTVQAEQGDLFDGPGGKTADLILSNPPYIRAGDLAALQREVEREPQTALDGGADGLRFYRAIAALWSGALRPGGCLAVEVGFDQAAAVAELFSAAGLEKIETRRDLSGIERVVLARKNG